MLTCPCDIALLGKHSYLIIHISFQKNDNSGYQHSKSTTKTSELCIRGVIEQLLRPKPRGSHI